MIPRTFFPAVPVEVWCVGRGGPPCRLRWRGRIAWVATVEASWHWSEGWWRSAGDQLAGDAAARRRYHRLTTSDGLRCVVYRDLLVRRWYLEAILD